LTGGVKICISPLKENVTVHWLPTQLSTTVASAGNGVSNPKQIATAGKIKRTRLKRSDFMA
jgi:hypothetical protein